MCWGGDTSQTKRKQNMRLIQTKNKTCLLFAVEPNPFRSLPSHSGSLLVGPGSSNGNDFGAVSKTGTSGM